MLLLGRTAHSFKTLSPCSTLVSASLSKLVSLPKSGIQCLEMTNKNMEHMIDPEQFVGLRGTVTPLENDDFFHEFDGLCIGVRHGFLQMRDQDDEVYEVEVRQFTPNIYEPTNF